jgi:hypothetical protein
MKTPIVAIGESRDAALMQLMRGCPKRVGAVTVGKFGLGLASPRLLDAMHVLVAEPEVVPHLVN